MKSTLSIIVPALNEASNIGNTISRLLTIPDCEIIIVDGQSSDDTVSIAREYNCSVLISPKGRGKQMNHGAKKATGDILLFLHADTVLPENISSDILRKSLNEPKTVAGSFLLKIDSHSLWLKIISFTINIRTRFFQLPYGDQALFLHRNTFETVGGFPDIEIMEDFVFVRNIKKNGKIALIKKYVLTSDRRWKNLGIIQTTLINQIIVVGYYLGISPTRLSIWYKRLKGVKNNST